ncbi:hypothetical protein DL766_002405 [Monosporascus sp. MC13-8B]|uniref:Uncharacterized protein n=1 Tax=Monosporascus cannonballus TaxID=155416 RepID=A0ABY0HIU5_9PEZI|nr:hypothetical protein DL762_001986 [Monosporascus cannonballus]RYO97110.1 hypothetical protein DL763_002900 [Monosporascus cannonballus]RYP35672.1 hypothetical protein DL766_002405 [Monosporascus sp. MC13-8B]
MERRRTKPIWESIILAPAKWSDSRDHTLRAAARAPGSEMGTAAPHAGNPAGPLSIDDAEHENRQIIWPVATTDSQVLADYLSAATDNTRGLRLRRPTPSNVAKLVVFTAIIEKLLEPHIELLNHAYASVGLCPVTRLTELTDTSRQSPACRSWREPGEGQLGDFWLSVGAFVLSSTVTFLLRYVPVAESNDSDRGQDELAQITSLRLTWDLGDLCLA